MKLFKTLFLALFGFLVVTTGGNARAQEGDVCPVPAVGQMTDLQLARINKSATSLTVAGVFWKYDDTEEKWTGIRILKGDESGDDKPDMKQIVIPGSTGISSANRQKINLHLSQVCATLKNKMEQRDLDAGTPLPERTYEVQSFLLCQSDYLGLELENLETVMNAPLTAEDENTCTVNYEKGISRLVQCIKASNEYDECKAGISELNDSINTLGTQTQDEETRDKIKEDTAARNKQQDALKNMTLNFEKQLALIQAYIGSIKYYAENARTRYKAIETGTFNVGRLSIGNEKDYSITTDLDSDTNLLNRIIRFLLGIIGTFAIVVIVIGAFFMIISNGDENLKVQGKTIVAYAVGGVVLAFLSYIIVQFVLGILFATGG
jgi:hypothetical protein